MDLLRRIESFPLFRGVAEEKLRTLLQAARLRSYGAGAVVLGDEEPTRSFYVVVDGQVKLSKDSPEGKEQTLNLLGPGDPFGMCAAFAIDPFPATAVALRPSELLLIPGPTMEAVALGEPRLLQNIIQLLSERLREAMALIESLSLKAIPQRLASFLLHDLEGSGVTADRLELSISQRELAKILGSTPEALSRAIRRMSNDGILSVDGRRFRILDRAVLEGLAEGE